MIALPSNSSPPRHNPIERHRQVSILSPLNWSLNWDTHLKLIWMVSHWDTHLMSTHNWDTHLMGNG